MENLSYADMYYDLSIGKNWVQINSIQGDTEGKTVRVTLDAPSGAFEVRQHNKILTAGTDYAVENGKVVICFKNISRSALNISADELMERFVRGDSSRNTEGSGLGLSIAQSLTSLQQGTFALSVDGDLFKASVTFDALS